MKKIISLGLATTLALGMAVPTFALGGGGGGSTTPTQNPTQSQAPSGGGSSGGSTQPSQAPSGGLQDGKLSATISGTTVGKDTSTIDLTLPTNLNGSIVLNPYALKYTDGYMNASTDRVISSGYKYIKNSGNNDLNVVWEVTGSASDGVVLEKKTPDQWTSTQGKAKSVFLPVMIDAVSADNATPTAADKKNDYTGHANLVYVTTEMQTNASTSSTQPTLTVAKDEYLAYGIKPVGTLVSGVNWWNPAADATNGGKTGGAWVSDGTYPNALGVVAAAGDINTDGKLDEPWTADDWVNVSFVFSFEVA